MNPAPSRRGAPWTANATDGQTIFARREFTVAQPPRSSVLWVTADDAFELFLNSQTIGATPATGDGLWKHVQRFSLADQLQAGRNVIAVRAENNGGAAGLVAQLEADGKTSLAATNSFDVLVLRAAPPVTTGPTWSHGVFGLTVSGDAGPARCFTLRAIWWIGCGCSRAIRPCRRSFLPTRRRPISTSGSTACSWGRDRIR